MATQSIFLLVGTLIAAFIEIGHATAGKKMFLRPALDAIADDSVRTTMNFVWYIGDAAFATIIVSALLATLTGLVPVAAVGWAAGGFFAAIGIIHLILAMRSGVPNALVRLFQWMLFFAAAAAFLAAAAV